MSTVDQIPNDWARDLEDFDFLRSLPVADAELMAMVGEYTEGRLDPKVVLRTENQRNFGSCRGHSGSTGLEWIGSIATGKPFQQLSRWMMYVESQRRSGIVGDRGATISAGIQQMQQVGCCDETLWPYPDRYTQQRPSNWQAVLENAAPKRIKSAKQIKSYDAARVFLGSYQGFIDCGISWKQSYAAPVVERFSGGSGGHAIALICLSERTDSQGRPYVHMFNSHGMSSGVNGWSEWSPTFVEQALQHNWTEMVACSDMPEAKPRKFSLEEWQKGLRV